MSMMEYDYTYTLPALRRSTKPIPIYDAMGKEFGKIQPFFKSTLDKILCEYLTIFDKQNYKFKSRDYRNGMELHVLPFKATLFKLRWYLYDHNMQNQGLFVNESKTTLSPTYALYRDSHTYHFSKHFIDHQTILRTDSGKEIAIIFYKKLSIRSTYYIKIYHEDELSLEEIFLLSLVSVKPMN